MPPATPIDFGDLRRLTPIDASFGLGRGKPIDRHYIENFLAQHRSDVRGHALEVAEDSYTQRFGGAGVTHSDILHFDRSNPRATVVGDLADGAGLPSAQFDCFICTQTLQYIYCLERVVATVYRMLKPGGVWLLTVPGISQISPYDRAHFGEYWRFTPQSVTRLLEGVFEQVEVRGHGNVLSATAMLQGLSCEDLSPLELDHFDDCYPMLVTARAVKSLDG